MHYFYIYYMHRFIIYYKTWNIYKVFYYLFFYLLKLASYFKASKNMVKQIGE